MVTGIGGREKKKAEARLRAYGALGANEEISGTMEAVSFDDTLEKLREVFEEGLSEDRTVPVCSERIYEVIVDFGRGLGSGRTARVNTKYKTVDWKVRPVATPLPEGSGLRMKKVASNPSLRDPADIGHRFTDKTLRELKCCGSDTTCCRRRNEGRQAEISAGSQHYGGGVEKWKRAGED
jgi:hypothetical protein